MEKNWRTETERQRRVTIYRSDSARWASDQKSDNSDEPILRKVDKSNFLTFLRRLRGLEGIKNCLKIQNFNCVRIT